MVNYAASQQDMTSQKKKLLETEMQRLDRLNLVGEMVRSIGHEIRNPTDNSTRLSANVSQFMSRLC